jgi:hypothetical protein
MDQLETTLPSPANANAFTCAEFIADKLSAALEPQLVRALPLVLNDDGGGIVKLEVSLVVHVVGVKPAVNVGMALTLDLPNDDPWEAMLAESWELERERKRFEEDDKP